MSIPSMKALKRQRILIIYRSALERVDNINNTHIVHVIYLISPRYSIYFITYV